MEKKARILIIEDDPDAAEVMRVTLEAQNHEVCTVSDPKQGFSEAKRKKTHLIILDVMFGKEEMTRGFDFAVRMKQDKELATIPILMVTAVNIKHPGFRFSPDTDAEFLPVDAFIDKPAQPKELAEKVQQLLEQRISKWSDWPRGPAG